MFEVKTGCELKLAPGSDDTNLILIEYRNKRFIKNWRPISLLNVDLKIISKALSEKLKKVLPDLISSQQTAYIKNRHIVESGRLISDVTEIAKIKKNWKVF